MGIRRPAPPLLQRAMGPCFACGEMGHLRPKMQSLERKWYPSHMLMHEFVPHVSALDVAKCCSGNCPTVLCDSVSECEVSVCERSDVLLDPGNVVMTRDVVEIDPENMWVRGETVSDTCVVVKGRLKGSISFWKHEIKAPASIISIIESGYVLKSEPTPFTNANHQSAYRNASFVQESISELSATGCIVEVPTIPEVCSPLSVVESNSGKKRLVINLRHLNRFLWKQKFKYEDLRVALLLFEKGDFMFSFDLKSEYHHADIAPKHWK